MLANQKEGTQVNVMVIGGNGLIGSAVVAYVQASSAYEKLIVTTRNSKHNPLDLAEPHRFGIGDWNGFTCFLCAGITGFETCAVAPRYSWKVNVDGVVNVAMRLIKRGTFIVYPSSEAVEWSTGAYASQRRQVEAVLLSTWYAAIVRCGRVTEENKRSCAEALFNRGIEREPGIYRWPQ